MKEFIVLLLALISLAQADTGQESIIPTKTEYERYLDQVLLVSK